MEDGSVDISETSVCSFWSEANLVDSLIGVYDISDSIQDHVVEVLRNDTCQADASVLVYIVCISITWEWNDINECCMF